MEKEIKQQFPVCSSELKKHIYTVSIRNERIRKAKKCFFALLAIFAIILMFAGCTTRTSYYPPTKNVHIEVKNEEGKIIEVRGPIKEQSSEFDLGTKGMGEYYLIKVDAL